MNTMYNNSAAQNYNYMPGIEAILCNNISEVAKKYNMSWYSVKEERFPVTYTLGRDS